MGEYKVRALMIICAAIGAFVFVSLNLPLPWLIGPMVSTVFLKLKYPDKVFFSLKIRNFFLIILGYNIGAHITLEACREIVDQFGAIFLANFFSIAVSLGLAWWTAKKAHISYASSAIGNMPGGLTPMLLICESIPQADINVVAVLQSFRLMATIAIVPFLLSTGVASGTGNVQIPLAVEFLQVPVWQLVLVATAGAVIAALLKMPAEYLLGPIISTGIFSVYLGGYLPEAPSYLLAVAQMATGLYLGTCIDPFQLGKNKALLPVCAIGSLVIIGASLLSGIVLSYFMGFSIATAFLASAPGGIAEMCVAGMVMGENVPVILSYQLFRLIILNFFMPVILKWYFTRKEAFC